jgi:hypothetical protein
VANAGVFRHGRKLVTRVVRGEAAGLVSDAGSDTTFMKTAVEIRLHG